MNVYPDFPTFAGLAAEGNLIPVYTELMADLETPVSVYAKLSTQGPSFLLESIEGGATLNRYSFIGCDPRQEITCYSEETRIVHRDGETETRPTPEDPLTLLEGEMAHFRPVALPGMPRFVGGAVGFLSYEYVHRVEPTVPLAAEDPLGAPLCSFLIADTVVIFDRARQTLRVLVNAHVDDDPQTAYEAAVQTLEDLVARLSKPVKLAPTPLPSLPAELAIPPSNQTRDQFEAMVERCKEYIRAGDVIQVVGSQRFSRDFALAPLDLYRVLRTVNPSPYMLLYETAERTLVGASPEVHVRLTDGLAEMRPIAGTRPRGADTAEDLAYENDLLADEKERAEHLMLVDLARNDLGRVCTFGSVKVPEFMIVERYSHVMHIVSQVEGQIADQRSAYDLMRATFPAGTVSGAPKIRAMQIIAEQEHQQRGPYAGAMAYFSFNGNLDSCILIRTALLQDGQIHIQSGAGLVADSVPASEWQETVNKATGMLRAVAAAEAMIR